MQEQLNAEIVETPAETRVADEGTGNSTTPPRPTAQDTLSQSEKDELFKLASTQIRQLAKTVHSFCQATVRETRAQALAEMLEQIKTLRGTFASGSLEVLCTFCSCLLRLFTALSEDLTKVNPSTLRTISNAVDFLRMAVWPGVYRRENEGHAIRVLVVDDNAVCRRALLMALNAGDLRVTCCNSGEEALEAAKQSRFDVVFTDIMMPRIDGFDFAKRVRALPGHTTTPIVFVTALSDFETRSRSILSGGCDLIAKPFAPSEVLVKALTFALGHRARKKGPQAAAPAQVAEKSMVFAPITQPDRAATPDFLHGVLYLDGKGNINTVNKDASALLGFTANEVAGWPVNLIFPDDLQHQSNSITVGRLLAGEYRERNKTDLTGRRKDKTTARFSVNLSEAKSNPRGGYVMLLRNYSEGTQETGNNGMKEDGNGNGNGGAAVCEPALADSNGIGTSDNEPESSRVIEIDQDGNLAESIAEIVEQPPAPAKDERLEGGALPSNGAEPAQNTELSAISAMFKQLSTRLDEQTSKVQELGGLKTTLENKLAASVAQISRLESQLKLESARRDQLERKVSQTAVAANGSDPNTVSALVADVVVPAQLQQLLEKVESRLDELSTSFRGGLTMEPQVRSIEAELTNLLRMQQAEFSRMTATLDARQDALVKAKDRLDEMVASQSQLCENFRKSFAQGSSQEG